MRTQFKMYSFCTVKGDFVLITKHRKGFPLEMEILLVLILNELSLLMTVSQRKEIKTHNWLQ